MSAEIELPRELQELLDRVTPEDRDAVTRAMESTLRTEAELRHAAKRMADAERIAHFGNWEWDIAADRLTWSEELYRIFGVERETFAATHDAYIELVHPHDRRRVSDTIKDSVSQATPYVFEHRVLLDEQTARTLRCHGEPVVDDDGQVVRLFGVCQDITERAESERGK